MVLTIYLITNVSTGKIYVGQTRRSIWRRIGDHILLAKRGGAGRLCKAMRESGYEHFTIETIATASSIEDLDRLEISAIAERRSTDPSIGYNISKGGQALPKARVYGPLSEEHKATLRATKSKPMSEEGRRNIGNAARGTKRTAETKAKMAAAALGKTHSAATRAKISDSRRGSKHTDAAKRKMSASRTGKKLSTEHRKHISASKMGHAVSKKQIERMRNDNPMNNPVTREKSRLANIGREVTTEQREERRVRMLRFWDDCRNGIRKAPAAKGWPKGKKLPEHMRLNLTGPRPAGSAAAKVYWSQFTPEQRKSILMRRLHGA